MKTEEMAASQRQEFFICVWEREWEGESVLCIYSGVFLCLATLLQQYWKQAAELHEQPERGDDVSVKSRELPLLAKTFLYLKCKSWDAWQCEWVPHTTIQSFIYFSPFQIFPLIMNLFENFFLKIFTFMHLADAFIQRDLQLRNISRD